MKRRLALWLTLMGTPVAWVSNAQQSAPAAPSEPMPAVLQNPEAIELQHPPFTFVRIRYTGSRRGDGSWATDFPDADVNFTRRLQEVTGWECDTNGMVLDLTDPRLKERSFIYIAEGGQMHLTDGEVQSLHDYLLGGGFLMVDDFWGEAEWESLAWELRRVFPDREPVDLPLSHEVFRSFYEIRKKPQVPNAALGIQSQFTGVTWEREDAKEPHYRGLFDDGGRLLAILCHNTDLGDGWERAGESEYYFREFSLKQAYPMGINIVVYALSHRPKEKGQRVEGRWTCESAIVDGKPLAEPTVKVLRLTLTKDRYRTERGTEVLFDSEYTLDASRNPGHIDIVGTEGDLKGRKAQGIYSLTGDTLKLCYTMPGKARPTAFESEAGSGASLIVWKRQKP